MADWTPGPGRCAIEGCERANIKHRQLCYWHWVANQPSHVQMGFLVDRDGAELWPGEVVCVDCARSVPSWYAGVRSKRCKGCQVARLMDDRAVKVYGMVPGEYGSLLAYQEGKCFICRKYPRTRALAVDHDHATGAVRGLLCASSNRGCNNVLLPLVENIETSRRVTMYLVDPPYQRMREGR